MGKHSLNSALQSRDGSEIAIVPRIHRHAAAIEQISDFAAWTDPEAVARSLRNAQNLYGLDAVTLGDGCKVAVGCRQASSPGLGPLEALSQNTEGMPLVELPSPEAVVNTPVLDVYLEACKRIKSVLDDRAGVAIVVPDDQALQDQLALQEQPEWVQEVLIHVIRAFGTLEPDLFMFVGTAREIPTRVRPIINYFGAAIVHVSPNYIEPGVRCLANETLEGLPTNPTDEIERPWLVTTREEVGVGVDVSRLGEVFDQARAEGR
tara:strand:+ start:3964 stop:4752 length:789 start_codon:yes stop_codon:yes gene_type:complete